MTTQTDWRLCPATLDDVDGLHTLASIPEVYRYLFDGTAPQRAAVRSWVSESIVAMRDCRVGLWVLRRPNAVCAGAVWLKPDMATMNAELGYMLHPAHWGAGLATRMAWTAVRQAFDVAGLERITAGTDCPNVRSVKLMQRLGMSLHGFVTYPLGPGIEYILHRNDPAPSPILDRIPIAN